MPLMRGPEAASILRKRGFCGIICGVTGNVSKEDLERFLSSGANFVLPKPLDMKVEDLRVSLFLSCSFSLALFLPLSLSLSLSLFLLLSVFLSLSLSPTLSLFLPLSLSLYLHLSLSLSLYLSFSLSSSVCFPRSTPAFSLQLSLFSYSYHIPSLLQYSDTISHRRCKLLYLSYSSAV
jgi:CheY-like chemotaxis protein